MAKRCVLITGGAGAIGSALSARFAAAGDSVVVADLPAALTTVASRFRTIELDVTDPDSIATALAQVGDVDVLINNAAILDRHGPLLEFDPQDLQATFAVNVHGVFQMTQLVGRAMVAAGRGGAIVNISSIGARQPTLGMGAYEASKAAADALMRWAAIELAPHGVRVNAVAPGPVLTPPIAEGMPADSPARQLWEARIPLKCFAETDDVAATALFLAGDEAKHITGVSLAVDGGQLLT